MSDASSSTEAATAAWAHIEQAMSNGHPQDCTLLERWECEALLAERRALEPREQRRKFRIGDCVTLTFTRKAVVQGPHGDREVVVLLRDGSTTIVDGDSLSPRDCDVHDRAPPLTKAGSEA